jgi:bifunctional enzyme CysN/CysC
VNGAQPEPKSQNLSTVHHRVSTQDRVRANGHRGAILWFTGLSGSGKSTLAVELERRLFARGYQVCLLDGDNVRQRLNADLGFSPEDRAENVRRIGEVARLIADAGMVAITAIISPYRRDRDRIRAAHGELFNEVFIDAPLDVCESRDTKGLYRKARAGLIKEFTGVSAPYEPPLAPELHIATATSGVDVCLMQILDYVEARLSAAQKRELQWA